VLCEVSLTSPFTRLRTTAYDDDYSSVSLLGLARLRVTVRVQLATPSHRSHVHARSTVNHMPSDWATIAGAVEYQRLAGVTVVHAGVCINRDRPPGCAEKCPELMLTREDIVEISGRSLDVQVGAELLNRLRVRHERVSHADTAACSLQPDISSQCCQYYIADSRCIPLYTALFPRYRVYLRYSQAVYR
jgi:hypothetical protein